MNRSRTLSLLLSAVASLMVIDMEVVATVEDLAIETYKFEEPSIAPVVEDLALENFSRTGTRKLALDYKGENMNNLRECEGDCDRDSDCSSGLKCFQRSGTQNVPGCGGGGKSGKDYCYAGGPSPSPGNLIYRGNNGKPSSVFPLGRCEGDCDSDAECGSGLRCFQRGGTQNVPGCGGGGISGKDYCYSGGPSPSPPNPPPPSSGSFRLKLYWQNGYFWQETRRELIFCMVCSGGCGSGSRVKVDRCSGATKWEFLFPSGNGIQIKVRGSNKCIELTGTYSISLQTCDSGKTKQRWVARQGSFGGGRFDIRPITKTDRCLTQHHHPKNGEVVFAEGCAKAHAHTTGSWNKY